MKGHKSPVDQSVGGLYRARVEFNKDTQQLGRVKVRIPHLHGVPSDESSLSYEDLPWAYPCTAFPSGYDHGSFVVPEVGSYVWVMFEAGDINYPVYLGSMFAKEASTYQPMGSLDSKDTSTKKYSDSGGRWNRPAYQSEVPDGVFSDREDYEPSTTILYKSPKGATFEIEESDELESMSLIDRLGQVIKFISPVTREYNSYNAHRRFNRSSQYGTQFDTEEVSFHKKALILIKDARNQFIRFLAKKGSSKVELVSTEDESHSVLELNSSQSRTLLESKYGNNRVRLELDARTLDIRLVVIENNIIVSSIDLSKLGISISSQDSVDISDHSSGEVCNQVWEDTKDESYEEGVS